MDLPTQETHTNLDSSTIPHVKKDSFMPIAMISAFLACGMALYLFWQNQQLSYQLQLARQVSPSPSPSPSADPISDWQTYTNTSANYSIKFPKSWNITNVAAGSSNNKPVPDARYIEIAPPKSNSTESVGNIGIEELQMIPPSEEKNLTTQKIIGDLTLSCNNSFQSDTKTWCWVKVPQSDKYLNIQVFKDINDEHNKLFDQILSTFKYTD